MISMLTDVIPSLIGGDNISSGDTYSVLDPNSGKVFAQVHDAGASMAEQAADAASEAFPKWKSMTLAQRREALDLAANYLDDREEELTEIAISDTGARREVAKSMQVGAAIQRLRSWANQDATLLSLPSPEPINSTKASLVRQPVGVVACISPYNFPLLAMVGKVAPALFAGNTVVMKPAPQDPLLVRILAEALEHGVKQVGGPLGTINYLVGSTPDSGSTLVEHPDVRAVSFTGSTTVGTEIYKSAAPTMKRLLLELGGKGALIVRDDTPLDSVIPAITRTWTYHAGQVCLTPARVLAYPRIHDQLLSALEERLTTLRHGDPRDNQTEIAPLISAEQLSRVSGLTNRADHAGLKVSRSSGQPNDGFHHPAVLISGADETAEIMQEEAFGPVIALMEVESDEHAISVANSTRYGLTDYVFSADVTAARKIANRLHSAQVSINTTARHALAPFGGNKLSGLGRSGGVYALDSYTDIQTHVELME